MDFSLFDEQNLSTFSFNNETEMASISFDKKFKLETNPIVRKRLQTKLLNKLKNLLHEYSIRIGQQIAVVCYNPHKTKKTESLKVYGTKPLEDAIRCLSESIVIEVEKLIEKITFHNRKYQTYKSSVNLPPLTCDNIPTSLDKMTQVQLRAFIPYLIKCTNGRGQPGWGRLDTKPVWWPQNIPWANVRSDIRKTDVKLKVPWTEALKQIIKNCYEYYGRSDMLYETNEDNELDISSTEKNTINLNNDDDNKDRTMNQILSMASYFNKISNDIGTNISPRDGPPTSNFFHGKNVNFAKLTTLDQKTIDSMNNLAPKLTMVEDSGMDSIDENCSKIIPFGRYLKMEKSPGNLSLTNADKIIPKTSLTHLNALLPSPRGNLPESPLLTLEVKTLQNLDGSVSLIPSNVLQNNGLTESDESLSITNNNNYMFFDEKSDFNAPLSTANSPVCILDPNSNQNSVGLVDNDATTYTIIVDKDGQHYLAENSVLFSDDGGNTMIIL